jgi:hypothetical protein
MYHVFDLAFVHFRHVTYNNLRVPHCTEMYIPRMNVSIREQLTDDDYAEVFGSVSHQARRARETGKVNLAFTMAELLFPLHKAFISFTLKTTFKHWLEHSWDFCV